MMMAQKEGRINLPLASSVSWGIDYIFQDLVDHWGGRMCATLDSGNPDCLEDGEVASTIGSVFERNPRPFAVPYLIASMCKYNKRGRFIGALGKIGTEDARFALLDFTQEQIACPNDQFVFRYLAPALEEACGEEAIPLLKAIRDGGFGDTAETAACRALMDLSQEGSQIDYEIEHILTSLRCVDEEGRPSDWQIVADMASWLRNYGLEKQLVQDNLERITSALEKAINHMHDGARKPVASTLGELGNSHTFDLLSKHLVEGVEPSQEVVEKILLALIRLAERGQISSRITTGVIKGRFSHVRLQYPSLTREVNLFEREILEYLKEKKRG
jgi:hypothetical protein